MPKPQVAIWLSLALAVLLSVPHGPAAILPGPLVVAAIPILLLAVASPRAAILMLLITLPLEAAFVIEVGLSIRLAYLFTAAAAASLLIVGRGKMARTGFETEALLIGALLVCSAAWAFVVAPAAIVTELSRLRGSSLRPMFQLAIFVIHLLAAFVLVQYIRGNRGRLEWALRTYVIVAGCAAAYGVYQPIANRLGLPLVDVNNLQALAHYGSTFAGTAGVVYRSQATFVEPLNFGHYLVSAASVLIALTVLGQAHGVARRPKTMIALFLTSLYFTGSRGALLGFAASMGVLLVLVSPRVAKRILKITAIALVGVLVVGQLAFMGAGGAGVADAVRSRLHVPQISFDARALVIRDIVAHADEHPLFGVGLGNYAVIGATRFDPTILVSAMGMPWGILAEMGIVGVLVFGFVFFKIAAGLVRVGIRSEVPWFRAMARGLLASLAGMMVQLTTFGDARGSLVLWITIGFALATVRVNAGLTRSLTSAGSAEPNASVTPLRLPAELQHEGSA